MYAVGGRVGGKTQGQQNYPELMTPYLWTALQHNSAQHNSNAASLGKFSVKEILLHVILICQLDVNARCLPVREHSLNTSRVKL